MKRSDFVKLATRTLRSKGKKKLASAVTKYLGTEVRGEVEFKSITGDLEDLQKIIPKVVKGLTNAQKAQGDLTDDRKKKFTSLLKQLDKQVDQAMNIQGALRWLPTFGGHFK